MRHVLKRASLLWFVWLFSSQVLAFQAPVEAEETVRNSVKELLSVVRKYDGNKEESARQAYLAEVSELLDPVIGYSVIARRVMGEAYEDATREQKIRFLDVFKRSLINTYAGGVYTFGAYDVVVLPSQDDLKDTLKNTRVYMEVVSPDGQRYSLIQSVYFSQASQDWKMQNAVFNGINLGVTFRTQFEQIYSDTGGNLDETIVEWERITEEAYKNTKFRE